MSDVVTIENGFAVVNAGTYLVSRGQPAAFLGTLAERRRKGLFLRDRARLALVEATGRIHCADASRPFLTHIPCAAPIFAVSSKVLLAPAAAWVGAELVKTIPMSFARALPVSRFEREWVVMATSSRTTRITVADGDTLSVRPDAIVAWTGNRPTGFCPRLGILDLLLPRPPRNFLLHFHGPSTLWLEAASPVPSKPIRRSVW